MVPKISIQHVEKSIKSIVCQVVQSYYQKNINKTLLLKYGTCVLQCIVVFVCIFAMLPKVVRESIPHSFLPLECDPINHTNFQHN